MKRWSGKCARTAVLLLAATAAGSGYGQEMVPCSILMPGTDGPYVTSQWPSAVVPYSFDAGVTVQHQLDMRAAMDEIENVSLVRFVVRTNEPTFLDIHESDANNSFVGYRPDLGGQVVNIFNWNVRFIMCHELIHALGFWHAQQRTDRDNYVQIVLANVPANQQHNFNTVNVPIFGPYDFDSVMHYGKCDFSMCNPCTTTNCFTILVPAPNQSFQNTIGQRDHMSQGDIDGMNFLYPEAWGPLGSGPSADVYALGQFNGELIVGGNFATAGGVNVNGIARWNGTMWQALGTGMNNFVNAVTVFNNELIAGGAFTMAGGNAMAGIARWNGAAWQPLGTGMSSTVWALTVFNNELIAGGDFLQAGGTTVNGIARWNGTTWQTLGTGMDNTVNSFSVFNNELIAGGAFTQAGGNPAAKIARWNGTTWQTLGTGMNNSVLAMTTFDGKLIAGGAFTQAGGNAAANVASWNGAAWEPLGAGMNGNVWALNVFRGRLIATGEFTTAGGAAANRIASFQGNMWRSMLSGFNQFGYALTVFGDSLYAGGVFTTAGGANANFVSRWRQTTGTGLFWLDFAYAGASSDGRFDTPYKTLQTALANVTPSSTIQIKPGNTNATFPAGINQPVTLAADGGPVTIGQ